MATDIEKKKGPVVLVDPAIAKPVSPYLAARLKVPACCHVRVVQRLRQKAGHISTGFCKFFGQMRLTFQQGRMGSLLQIPQAFPLETRTDTRPQENWVHRLHQIIVCTCLDAAGNAIFLVHTGNH